MIHSDPRSSDDGDQRSAAATYVTTEHFVLQGARTATIAESNGRANMFLAAVSGGLVALGLVGDRKQLGAAISGSVVALPVVIAMIRHQDSAWQRAAGEPLRPAEK